MSVECISDNEKYPIKFSYEIHLQTYPVKFKISFDFIFPDKTIYNYLFHYNAETMSAHIPKFQFYFCLKTSNHHSLFAVLSCIVLFLWFMTRTIHLLSARTNFLGFSTFLENYSTVTSIVTEWFGTEVAILTRI